MPRRTRQRIFEPAFYDLLRQSLLAKQSSPLRFGGQALRVFAGSFAVALWRALFSRRLLTIGIVLTVIAILLTFMLRSWIGDFYGEVSAN